MKRNHTSFPPDRRRWAMPLLIVGLVFLILILTVGNSKPVNNSSHRSKFTLSYNSGHALGIPKLPRIAYLISGTKADSARVKRLLQAVYHPRNYYLLHLDLEASDAERLEIAKYVKSKGVIREFVNVI